MARSSSSKGSVRRKGKEVVEDRHQDSSKGRSSHRLHLLRSHSSRRAAVSEHSGREAPARMVREEEEAEEAHQALHREATRSLTVLTAGLSRAIRIDR